MTTPDNPAKPPARPRRRLSALATVLGIPLLILLLLAVLIHFFLPHRDRGSTTLVQDGRVLGNAAQQYFMTTGATSASFSYDPKTGAVTGDLTPWVTNLQKGYDIGDFTIEAGNKEAFFFTVPYTYKGYPIKFFKNKKIVFSDEGKTTSNPAE